ncbi:hypothetical protein [Quadrisphaera setariae]|uniref:Core-binding (CB) domain-containing protein n=1 Tax=Quadrisphaera setariae TaxID=2593304 RepID=A0A5C8ZFQ9_9ACTN|nr:hypothetical protein [Quadrisphaera setariae]TXR55756.1 hypothetical protein FMM08_13110 [Quadrisphaera setariae]
MALPARPLVDTDIDVDAAEVVSSDSVVDCDLKSRFSAGPAFDAGARHRAGVDGDDLNDGDVLTDAAVEGRLQLASAGVLPELDGLPEREAAHARAARAENTLRAYRSDWAEFATWCCAHDADPMPATPSALTGNLVALAQAGARVGTLSRRLSSIKFAHASAGHPAPATHPRVITVWEGIRRVHGAPPSRRAR